jgi:putative transposase
LLVDRSLASLEGLASRAGHRPARDGDRVATERLSLVLELEDSPRQNRPTGCCSRGPRFDSPLEPRKPALGAPHIHGELLKLDTPIGETSVAKYMVRHRKPPSQTWRTFLDNHLKTLVSIDFFTVTTIRFQVLYVFLVLAHERRRVVHFNVTAHPTAEWTAQQLREAFPFDQIPRYLLRDRDKIFGDEFRRQVRGMKVEEVLSAPRSPWQRAYVERLIGSIRRECLDHVIVLHEAGLRRMLSSYFAYYHHTRPHLSLDKDAPESRKVQPPELGKVVSIPQVGGLHHRYERLAA